MTPPIDLRPLNPFVRLNRLVAGLEPGASPRTDGRPLDLGIGDPRTGMPSLAHRAMEEAVAGWSSYPPFQGEPALLRAAETWLTRTQGLPEGFLAERGRILPVSGSREGIFFLVAAATTAKQHALGGARPVALLPDPGYHVYAGATLAADAEPYYLAVGAAGGHQPDLTQVPAAVLERAAIAFLCSPANPQGAAAGAERLRQALALARRHGFLLLADECYADLYFGTRPLGALAVAAETPEAGLANLVTAHSLSKRSGAPGLRCGFLAGDPVALDSVEGLLRFGGAAVPQPVAMAGAALLGDEAHVEANRAFYRRNLEIAEARFRQPFGWSPPDGGFFAWLDVGASRFPDGESAAREIWLKAGIRTLPGGYMSLAQRPEPENPGRPYLRIALVDEPDLLDRALARIVQTLL